MTRQDQAIWFFRVLTPLSVIAGIGAMWGTLSTDVSNQREDIRTLDKRVTSLETISVTAQNNAYRLSRMDSSIDALKNKGEDDHDTLVRIDQTVTGMATALDELKSDVKNLRDTDRSNPNSNYPD